MRLYALEELKDALEIALEDTLGAKSLAEYYGQPLRSRPVALGASSGSRWSGDHWTYDMPNAEQELKRDLDALQHICPDRPREIWRKVVAGIADRHLGSALGREIALRWSHGGTIAGMTFRKPSGEYTIEEFEACWRDACGNSHLSIGTIFHIAKEHRWNSSRVRWGLGRTQRCAGALSSAALKVIDAGRVMPKERPNLERIAWYWRLLKQSAAVPMRSGLAS